MQGIFVIFCIISFSLAEKNYLEIYSGPDQTGDGIILRSKLPTAGDWEFMINKGRSYCFVGWWKAYTEIDYQGRQSKNLGTAHTRACSNAVFTTNDKSLRYYGPPDLTTSAISLYDGTITNEDPWMGKEIVVETQAATNFGFIPTGLVLTGSANWTTFTNSDFTGNSTCYINDSDGFSGIRAQRTIQSLVKGCESYPIDRYVYASQVKNYDQGVNKDVVKSD